MAVFKGFGKLLEGISSHPLDKTREIEHQQESVRCVKCAAWPQIHLRRVAKMWETHGNPKSVSQVKILGLLDSTHSIIFQASVVP